MHVRADAVCIGDSRTDGVRFGDARPGRTSAATALVPVGDIARIANAGFIHSRTATASAAAHAASGGLARRRAGYIVLARAARGRHHPAVQPQTILTADLHGLLDPLEPARGRHAREERERRKNLTTSSEPRERLLVLMHRRFRLPRQACRRLIDAARRTPHIPLGAHQT